MNSRKGMESMKGIENTKSIKKFSVILVLVLIMAMTACGQSADNTDNGGASEESGSQQTQQQTSESVDTSDATSIQSAGDSVSLKDVPKFSGDPYVVINENKPSFTKKELTSDSYEDYSSLDSLGRCGVAAASIGRDLMPDEKRGSIGQVKPSGWETIRYDFVEGKYLYNRCHLIGYQLSGENANEENLITGTRFLNTEGMLPFENMIADYVKETGNHVMYRVTPIYKGRDLVASGVQMEARSVEDRGDGISFNVYAYNDQPGIKIDHATGASKLSKGNGTNDGSNASASKDSRESSNSNSVKNKKGTYIINTNTGKFHLPSCRSIKTMKDSNKKVYKGKRKALISRGYEPCKICNP